MNKMGRAIVQMLVSGVETEYAIQAQPVEIDEIASKSVENASFLDEDVLTDASDVE